MFTNFTWWQFFGTFLLLSVIYYPLILSLYFRNEVTLFWKKFMVAPLDSNEQYGLVEEDTTTAPMNYAEVTSDAVMAGRIADLTEDLTNGIKAAADSHASKDQVFTLLKNILAKYPQLRKNGQRVQINEFIIQECARSNYTVHMAQVYALWASAAESIS